MKEREYIKIYQRIIVISSILLVAGLVSVWIISGPAREYRHYQREYIAIWDEVSDTLEDIQLSAPDKGIKQLSPEGLNRTDRCITCHMGIENPYMEGLPQPYGAHPGDYLSKHPIDKYACTVCHGGQGRALNVEEAHAVSSDVHWDYPLLKQPYLESSCGQCHLSIFGKEEVFEGTEVFSQGHDIFASEGCLGCHKARGVGGIIGPDLTEQGEKTRHEYNFQHIELEQTVSNWLKEHFRDPEMVSPGSRMLKIDLPENELDALSTFVLGLKKPDIDFSYFSLPTLHEFKGDRVELEKQEAFSMICSACHGKEGEGKDYEQFETGVPGIMRDDFRSVVSPEYVLFTLRHGRSHRQMAAWTGDISGLRATELDSIKIWTIGTYKSENVDISPLLLRKADPENGGQIFSRNCASCHGDEGMGGVALSLNRADLMQYLDNNYLYETLLKGRRNATMPSWRALPSEDIYDLVSYLRGFGNYVGGATMDFSNMDSDAGRLQFRFLCSRCHGQNGEGQTGPANINKDFLEAASDLMLYKAISQGREHTPMFGWSKDVYNAESLGIKEIGNIVKYMREVADAEPAYIYAGANPGELKDGEILYRENCAECHGSDGEGKKAPALNNQELLNAASNGYLMATITLGRSGTAMPEWGYPDADRDALSAEDRRNIVAWLRNWERIRIKY